MPEEQQICDQIANDFALEVPAMASKQQILTYLQQVVSGLLEGNAERFFQLMYRLDISEKKLEAALADRELGIMKVAQLIYDRQLQKLQARQSRPPGAGADKELEW